MAPSIYFFEKQNSITLLKKRFCVVVEKVPTKMEEFEFDNIQNFEFLNQEIFGTWLIEHDSDPSTLPKKRKMQYINLSDIKKKLQDDEMMEREKYISILREELSRAESMEQIFETFTVSSPYIKSHPESPLYIEFLFFQGDVETQLLGGVNIVRNTAKLRINCSENTSHVEFSVDNGPKKKLKLIKHPQNAKIKLAELQFKDYSDSISGTNIVELKIESGKTQISHPICFYQNDNQISKLYYKMFNHFLSKNPLDVAIKTFHRNQLGVGLHEESMRYLLEVGKDKLCHWFPEVILMLNKVDLYL